MKITSTSQASPSEAPSSRKPPGRASLFTSALGGGSRPKPKEEEKKIDLDVSPPKEVGDFKFFDSKAGANLEKVIAEAREKLETEPPKVVITRATSTVPS